ncbi:MAG: putative HTH-type transcriptional regulator YttP [Candidatus Heimdallarchaeota archaeon AB_125]|nr:MAG: putative HTH-type transcriptional regulator YttP [Candidatus Heimdallarchaeota archaeon AB_125]
MRTRDQKKYNAVVRSTIELTNKLGFSGISISKIAKEANVSPATIYIYFKNKEDLLTVIYCDIRKKAGESVLTNIDTNMTIKERFNEIWFNSFSFYLNHPEYIQYREQFEQTKMMEEVKTNEFELNKYIVELFAKGIEDRIIQDIPIPMLISFAFIPIITLLRFHFSDIQIMTEEGIINACKIAWKSIAI